MCGRYGYTNADREKVKKRFRLKDIPFELVPRYNITPGEDVPVVLNEDPQELTMVRWGLVPFWAKEEKIGYKMINARAETVFEKPAYRRSIKHKRCLILVDHFFEWKQTPEGKKPFCMRMKDEGTFTLAGLWDVWQEKVKTCSIITTEPNRLMKSIHDRMPVILRPEDEESWLQENDPQKLVAFLKPFDPESMQAQEVSRLVNSPANKGKEIIEPVV